MDSVFKEPLFDKDSHGSPMFPAALDAPLHDPSHEPMEIDLSKPQPKYPQKFVKTSEKDPEACMQQIVQKSAPFITASNMKQSFRPIRSDSPANLPTDYGIQDGEPEPEKEDDEETEDEL